MPRRAPRSVHSVRYKTLLTRLKAARKKANLTQVQVATALGKQQSYVSKCESGERRMDPIDLADFARLYRQPVGHFLDGLT